MPTIIGLASVGPSSVAPPPPPPSAKPDASNTGWAPTGVTLTAYPASGGPAGPVTSGVLTITTPNLTLDSYNFGCYVSVKAANVTLKRSLIRGNASLATNAGLITATNAAVSNLLVQDCILRPDFPSQWWTGIIGHDYTARRCDISRTVDGGGGYNTASAAPVNILFDACYIHDLAYFSPDSNHSSDSPVSSSHSDGYQGQGGSGHTFRGCNIQAFADATILSADGSSTADILRSASNPNGLGGYSTHYPSLTMNAAFQFTQPATPVGSAVAAITIDGNWLDGGGYTINVGAGVYAGVTIINNRFGHGSRLGVVISVPNAATGCVISGNIYDDTGLPTPVQRY